MLRTVRIEHFRGVRSAEVSFDRTTVLIGENDSGMTSILEALALALSPADGERPRIEARQFHLASDAPVSIELTFGESRTGSWDRPGLEALAPILGRRIQKPRTLTLAITASRPARDEAVEAHWEIRSPGGRTSRDDTVALSAVRKLNALVWLRHGALVEEEFSADEAASVLRGFDFVLRGGADGETAATTAGMATTRRLLGEWVQGVRPRTPQMRAMVSEILDDKAQAAPDAGDGAAKMTASGSTAQRVGVFMIAAKMLRELSRVAEPGVRPILLVEEPEAHLHPMTLASVAALLDLFTTQKIITTQSGALLAGVPLQSVRRLVRDRDASVRAFRAGRESMSRDDLRKVGYHLRARRSVACFARTWLLVEGETEFWVMPDLARLCGYDFAQEGVACVEYAQCGLVPLVRFANALGISWHMLTDGDRAGNVYSETLRPYLGADRASRLTRLTDLDIEHCFWRHGYASVFERLAGMHARGMKPSLVIRKAIERSSKPDVAFELLAAVAARGSPGPPPPLKNTIETCVRLARGIELEQPPKLRSAQPRRTGSKKRRREHRV